MKEQILDMNCWIGEQSKDFPYAADTVKAGNLGSQIFGQFYRRIQKGSPN